MDNPLQAGNEPVLVELIAGKSIWWCACGKSASQPFCDGSHKGTTSIMPLLFTPDKDESVNLCTCKKTKNPPYCDGSHLTLENNK